MPNWVHPLLELWDCFCQVSHSFRARSFGKNASWDERVGMHKTVVYFLPNFVQSNFFISWLE